MDTRHQTQQKRTRPQHWLSWHTGSIFLSTLLSIPSVGTSIIAGEFLLAALSALQMFYLINEFRKEANRFLKAEPEPQKIKNQIMPREYKIDGHVVAKLTNELTPGTEVSNAKIYASEPWMVGESYGDLLGPQYIAFWETYLNYFLFSLKFSLFNPLTDPIKHINNRARERNMVMSDRERHKQIHFLEHINKHVLIENDDKWQIDRTPFISNKDHQALQGIPDHCKGAAMANASNQPGLLAKLKQATINRIIPGLPWMGCSGLNRGHFLGNTFDWIGEIGKYISIPVTFLSPRSTEENRFAVFTLSLPFSSLITGINSEGLFLTLHEVEKNSTANIHPAGGEGEFATMLRMGENCKNPAEIEESLQKHPPASPFIFIIRTPDERGIFYIRPTIKLGPKDYDFKPGNGTVTNDFSPVGIPTGTECHQTSYTRRLALDNGIINSKNEQLTSDSDLKHQALTILSGAASPDSKQVHIVRPSPTSQVEKAENSPTENPPRKGLKFSFCTAEGNSVKAAGEHGEHLDTIVTTEYFDSFFAECHQLESTRGNHIFVQSKAHQALFKLSKLSDEIGKEHPQLADYVDDLGTQLMLQLSIRRFLNTKDDSAKNDPYADTDLKYEGKPVLLLADIKDLIDKTIEVINDLVLFPLTPTEKRDHLIEYENDISSILPAEDSLFNWLDDFKNYLLGAGLIAGLAVGATANTAYLMQCLQSAASTIASRAPAACAAIKTAAEYAVAHPAQTIAKLSCVSSVFFAAQPLLNPAAKKPDVRLPLNGIRRELHKLG